MPSPKAVLRDIADLGLDPRKAHSLTHKAGVHRGGRLNPGTAEPDLVSSEEVPVIVEEKPVQVEKKPSRFEKKEKVPAVTPVVELEKQVDPVQSDGEKPE